MRKLETRVAALEQATSTSTGPIFVHFVGMGTKDSEIERITCGVQEWQRQPHESEQDLKDRANREATPPQPDCCVVFFCY